MPTDIKGGGEKQPSAPGLPDANEAEIVLTVPVDGDVADVPGAMTKTAGQVIKELEARLTEVAADRAYQKKIVVRTTRPTNPLEYPEGTVIYVVPS